MSALLILISLLNFSFAEYRVYQLSIVDSKGEPVKEVMSTIDHLQYSEYFHIPPNQSVVYVDSWKCYGHTGNFKSYCNKPKIGRNPASEEFTPN